MIICEEVRELIPWYVTGRIAFESAMSIADHMKTCEDCRADFVEAAWLRRLVASQAEASPTPKQSVWVKVSRKTGISDLAQIDVGSFLIGMKLGIATGSSRYPVRGTLRVMGHDVRIVGRRKRKREAGRVQKR